MADRDQIKAEEFLRLMEGVGSQIRPKVIQWVESLGLFPVDRSFSVERIRLTRRTFYSAAGMALGLPDERIQALGSTELRFVDLTEENYGIAVADRSEISEIQLDVVEPREVAAWSERIALQWRGRAEGVAFSCFVMRAHPKAALEFDQGIPPTLPGRYVIQIAVLVLLSGGAKAMLQLEFPKQAAIISNLEIGAVWEVARSLRKTIAVFVAFADRSDKPELDPLEDWITHAPIP
jgi:hypothetical protein